MKTTVLFTQLLNISLPFRVDSVIYKNEDLEKSSQKSVHIYISVETSAVYRPTESTIKDYDQRTWRYLSR